jgi:DNA modification methylase
VVPRIPKPHTRLTSNSATFCFYHGDCVDILDRLSPGSIDAIVTSPPYNLGIRYRSYDDTMPRHRYLEWTGEWESRAARAMAPNGSLFLNVGAKPTDPADPFLDSVPRLSPVPSLASASSASRWTKGTWARRSNALAPR